jgi:hypothetical protein
MNQETEDQSINVVSMAKFDITVKQKRIERDRMIDVRFEPAVDAKGNQSMKMHRVRREMDWAKGVHVEYDIANYSTAEALRTTAEEYIFQKVSPDLELFEKA